MSAIGPERYRTRAPPFLSVMEGVRIDEELARKASVVHPHRECESRSLRQHWKKSGIDEDTALKAAAGSPVVGAIPTSSAIFDAAPVRYASGEVLWPTRVCFVNEKFRREGITWCRAAKVEPRSCRHVIPARISSTRPGVITSFGTRSIRWRQSWPTLVFRNFSSGCISSRIWLSSAANAVELGDPGNTISAVLTGSFSLSP